MGEESLVRVSEEALLIPYGSTCLEWASLDDALYGGNQTIITGTAGEIASADGQTENLIRWLAFGVVEVAAVGDVGGEGGEEEIQVGLESAVTRVISVVGANRVERVS